MNNSFFNDGARQLMGKCKTDHDYLNWCLRREEIRDSIEEMWCKFHLYAVSGFKERMLMSRSSFLEHWWEMLCGVGLINLGFDIDTLKNVGPDFYIGEFDNKKHYVECIAPGLGDLQNADRLPEMELGVHKLPEDQFLLRIASGLSTKLEKYQKDLEKGIVNDTDCLVIAISSCNLSNYGSLMDYPVSAIDKVLHGYHHPAIDLNTNETFITMRESIRKANESKVRVTLFGSAEFESISAVIYSNASPGTFNPGMRPESTFVFRENEMAENRCSQQFCNRLQQPIGESNYDQQ